MEELEDLFYRVIDHLGGQPVEVEEAKPLVVQPTRLDVEDFVIPLGVSNHHIHLSQADADTLFGTGYEFQKLKDLSQTGQFAVQECVFVAGPKGILEKVRILGPVRSHSQVELTVSDCFKLGIKAPLRLSGDLAGSPGCTLIGPKGSVQLTKGCIVAKRHIHMSPLDAREFGVQDGQEVSLECSGERGGILKNVTIRVHESFNLECHLDTEEANALGVSAKNKLKLIK
ncbi:propanediol utilization protein [Streptococcus gallinaceus]|uniref:phosphate propanoyltransferase n=1 Tax=Streptococcus gallinaceus TaxID=165758 RepID=UPI0029F61892|nr:propanediol utilization protein [Streptococcus gallinaceus]MCP1770181.1 propanediol utilization protein [Streptococcus gallinaceus]